ncbi:Tn3 family transposase, partial [Stutzerimonas stutzeri]|uniref:Tn3 family transposase n=1 Tax=Stutzerimonas stutzeri TaxID=316 RepID=UPI003D02F605
AHRSSTGIPAQGTHRPRHTESRRPWNTVYLERAAHALRGNGHAVDDALLQYLSPLGWEHINLTGDYLWRSSAKIGAGKFRPLRPLQPA